MRRDFVTAALVLCFAWPALAGLDTVSSGPILRDAEGIAPGAMRLAQSSLAVIDAPKRIDTDQETVDFSGRAMAPGEVTLTVNGRPVMVAPDGSFRIRQTVPVGRSRLTLVLQGSYGDKAEHKVFVRRTAAVAETLDFGTFHALVIGNNNYDHLKDLKTAATDAEAVAALLSGLYGFEVETLIDATRYDIISALARKRAQLTERDNLLIYYAGHGNLDVGSDEGYWLPTDAESDNPVNWVSNATISAQLRAMRAKHVMVVADSCYSGKLTRSVVASLKTGTERTAWFERMNTRRSRTALTSGGLEPVLDAGGGKHSVFAKAFLEALENNTAVLDGQALFDAIKRPIVVNADQTPEYADVSKAGHDGGDFLFVRVGVTPEAPVAVTPEAPVAVTPEAPAPAGAPAATFAAAETTLWRAVKDSSNANDYQAYLDAYPAGVFAPLARARIRALNADAEMRADERMKPFELAFWAAITGSADAADYAAYLEKFPDGEFAPLARARLAAAERAAAEEAERERAAAEAAERERHAAEEAERERRAAEQAAREEAERVAAEEKRRKEVERKVAEEAARKAAERKAAEEAQRKEAERIAAEEAARKAAEEARRREAERLAAEAAAKAERMAAERTLWDAARTNARAADYRAYLAQYPNGLFATLAQVRLAEVERKAAAEAERKRAEAERRVAEEGRRKEAERKAAEEAKAEREAQQEVQTAFLVAPAGAGTFDGTWVGQISNEHVHLYKDVDIKLSVRDNEIIWHTTFPTKHGRVTSSLRGNISDTGDFSISSLFSGSGGWSEWRISMHGKFAGDHAAGWVQIDHGSGPFVIKRVSRQPVAETAAERERRAAEKAKAERETQQEVQTALLMPPGAGAFDGVWEGTISNEVIVGHGPKMRLTVANNVITLDTAIYTRQGVIRVSATGTIDDSGKFYLWDKFEAMGSWYEKIFSMDGKFSGNRATGKLKISREYGAFDLERVSLPASPKAAVGP